MSNAAKLSPEEEAKAIRDWWLYGQCVIYVPYDGGIATYVPLDEFALYGCTAGLLAADIACDARVEARSAASLPEFPALKFPQAENKGE